MSSADLDQLTAALADRYTIARELGGGGMSRVFLAEDLRLRRQVVVKVLSSELSSEISATRFEREILLAANLQHPHIVPLLAAGEAAGLPYYVMPYVAGDSLRARLGEGRVPLPEAVRLLREIASALAHAHARGLIHRDVKPENVLLSDGYALVTDFGVAKAVQSARESGAANVALTTAGISLGTPLYMAPEQAAADPATDHRADIYAWGVMAYEILSGAPPFRATTRQALMVAHAVEKPPVLLDRSAAVPPDLSRLVMQCLEKQPGDRPASAGELVQALDKVSAATSGAAGAREVSRRSRNIALTALAAVAIGAAAVLVIGKKNATDADALPPAVAVLPFDNLAAKENEYFSDGVTEEIINSLSRIRGLRIPSRATLFAIKGTREDPTTIAEKLHVDAILTGSVRRAGDRLRVTAQLVKGSDGNVLWSESYDRRAEDVFAIQEDIASEITSALRVTLVGGGDPVRAAARPRSLAAYDRFLRAKAATRPSRLSLDSAIAYYLEAAQLDPGYAPVFEGLSSAYHRMAEYVQPLTVLPKAKAAAVRAVQLDPQNPAAHTALARILLNFDWDWPGAEREFRRAIELDPEFAPAHEAYADFLGASRRGPEAINAMQRAAELHVRQSADTAAARITARRRVCMAYVVARERAGAKLECEAMFASSPRTAAAHHVYGLYLMGSAEYGEAVRHLEKASEILGNAYPQYTHLGIAYARAGMRDKALVVLADLQAASRSRYIPKDQEAALQVALGNRDAGMRALEQAVDERHYWLPQLNGFSGMDPVRYDPQYQRLMRRVGVPENAL